MTSSPQPSHNMDSYLANMRKQCDEEIKTIIKQLYDFVEKRFLYIIHDFSFYKQHEHHFMEVLWETMDGENLICASRPPDGSYMFKSARVVTPDNGMYKIGNWRDNSPYFPCDLLLAVQNNTPNKCLTIHVLFCHNNGCPDKKADYSFDLSPGQISWMGPDHHYIPFSTLNRSDMILMISCGGMLVNGEEMKLTFFMGKLTEQSSLFFRNRNHRFKMRDGSYLHFHGNLHAESIPADQINRHRKMDDPVNEFNHCAADAKLTMFAFQPSDRAAQRNALWQEKLLATTWDPSRVVDWCLDVEEQKEIGEKMAGR